MHLKILHIIKGKEISEVARKSRTLRTFLPRPKSALWIASSFASSFGLDVIRISVKEPKLHTVPGTLAASSRNETQQGFGFENLC